MASILNQNNDIYSLELVQAISDWQNSGYGDNKDKNGEKIIELTKSLPEKFRSYSGYCYRKFNSSGKTSLTLGLNNFVNEKYSSWTTNYSIAKKLGKLPNNKQIAIIFKIKLEVTKLF